MSCWVVPSIAAELWGCTIDAVMSAIHNGKVTTKEDAGWTFIDVAPDSPVLCKPKALLNATPDTYVSAQAVEATAPDTDMVITAAESEALAEPMRLHPSDADDNAEMSTDWRVVRNRVSTSRRPPLAQAA